MWVQIYEGNCTKLYGINSKNTNLRTSAYINWIWSGSKGKSESIPQRYTYTWMNSWKASDIWNVLTNTDK